MEYVKNCLKNEYYGRVLVTGSPGIGKSQFYLYCAFQLIKSQLAVVNSLSPFKLVMNCQDCYFLYDADRQELRYLYQDEIVQLSFKQMYCDSSMGAPTSWNYGMGCRCFSRHHMMLQNLRVCVKPTFCQCGRWRN
ncbi:hypothetical protein JG687_00013159 [Phytophthora cactorum]|uniref:Uncharacterized protein n=1 Tax=Phytophthora cactorum TaxID=29920 RepID=A0A8T1TZZ1_9STRA|nr:hypothetical protein JG687_00013159 [Phytophthora cactorum]